jgi:hypothetical protein
VHRSAAARVAGCWLGRVEAETSGGRGCRRELRPITHVTLRDERRSASVRRARGATLPACVSAIEAGLAARRLPACTAPGDGPSPTAFRDRPLTRRAAARPVRRARGRAG